MPTQNPDDYYNQQNVGGYYDHDDPRQQQRSGNPRDQRGDQRRDPRDYDPRAMPQGKSNTNELRPGEEAPDVPKGLYPIKAFKHRFGEAANERHTKQIGVMVVITRGQHEGKRLLWYGSFTDLSYDITVRAMKALGHQGDDILNCDGFYAADAPEATAVVDWERNPKTDKLVAKVKFINGGDIVMGRDMNDADSRRFQQHMRGILSRYGGGASASSTGRQPQNGAPPPPPQDRRPPPEQRPSPSPGREYNASYNGPPRGAAPPNGAPQQQRDDRGGGGGEWSPPPGYDRNVPY